MMVETVANKQGDEKHSVKKSREKLNLLIENNSRGEKDTAIQSQCKRNLEISSKDDTIDAVRKRKIINDETSNTTHIEEASQEEALSQVKKKDIQSKRIVLSSRTVSFYQMLIMKTTLNNSQNYQTWHNIV